MYCLVKKLWCEDAGEITIIDQKTGEELRFTMCYIQHAGRQCPWDKVEQMIRDDIEQTHRIIGAIKSDYERSQEERKEEEKSV